MNEQQKELVDRHIAKAQENFRAVLAPAGFPDAAIEVKDSHLVLHLNRIVIDNDREKLVDPVCKMLDRLLRADASMGLIVCNDGLHQRFVGKFDDLQKLAEADVPACQHDVLAGQAFREHKAQFRGR